MAIRASIGSSVGHSDHNHWGQVLITPHAYGVIEVETQEKNARNRGVQVLAELSRRLSTVDASEISVSVLGGAVWDDVIRTLILLIPSGDSVVVLLRGEGRVYLKRGEQLAALLSHPGVITGQLKSSDAILLVSSAFTRVLSHAELASTFDHLPAPDAAEKLTTMLHGREGGLGAVALVYKVERIVPDAQVSDQETPRLSSLSWSRFMPRWNMSSIFWFTERLRGRFWRLVRIVRTERRVQLRIFILFLIVGFISSVTLGITRQQHDRARAQFTAAIQAAEYGLDEGVALLELNKVKSRERLFQAKQEISGVVSQATEKTPEGRTLLELNRKLDEALVAAKQIVSAEPALYYDVSLLKKGAEAGVLSLFEDTLIVLDRLEKTVFSIDLASKNAQILAGGEQFRGATFSGIGGDKIYTLTERGIHETRLSDKKTTLNRISLDTGVGLVTGLVAYGGNVYLSDSTNNAVWRYNGAESGFSNRRPYLNPDVSVQLGKVTSMAVDGSLWFGTSEGKILRFTQGLPREFVPRDVDSPLGQQLMVYTSDTVKHVYVADVANSRVVVFDKDGNYNGQYVWQGEYQITSFVASESSKRLIFSSGGTMYAFELK